MFDGFPNELSVEDIAKAYRICSKSASYLINSGRLKSIKRGRKRFVPKDEAIYFLTHP